MDLDELKTQVALGDWPQIDFTDDQEGNLFISTIHRKASAEWVQAENGSEKSSEKILALVKANPNLAAGEVADILGITPRAVEKQISKLRDEGRICVASFVGHM